jgi:protein TonB
MKTDSSQSHSFVAPAGASHPKPVSLRGRLGVAAFALAGFAIVGVGSAASASPGPDTGPTVTVRAARVADEAAYVSAVRLQLDRAKRYPTGREASLSRPSGTTAVWVDIARDGHPVGRGVVRSSGSGLLDWTATNLVGRADYPAFPADAWSDGPTHRFLVSYRFVGGTEEPGGAQVEVAVDR